MSQEKSSIPDTPKTPAATTAQPKKKKEPKGSAAPAPAKTPPEVLPPWKVLLHNDDVNEMGYVVLTIMQLCRINEQDAILRTEEAHKKGLALLTVTHKERAELFKDQFTSKGLTVTIEPAE